MTDTGNLATTGVTEVMNLRRKTVAVTLLDHHNP